VEEENAGRMRAYVGSSGKQPIRDAAVEMN